MLSPGTEALKPCPACSGLGAVEVGGPALAFTESGAGGRFVQPDYSVRRCSVCDLYFKSRTLPPSELGAYYAQLSCEIYEAGEAFPTERYLRHWLDQLPDGSRVLDFGCSTGRTLAGVSSRLACVGVEVNEVAAKVARARGIRIVREAELSAEGNPEFAAIVLSDVYEHLPRPAELVGTLASWLAPEGWLAIVTGNADAVRPRARFAEFWYFRSVGHLHMASEAHIHWLASRVGLRVAAVHFCSHYQTPLASRARQWAQGLAYNQFRDEPSGLATSALRLVPGLNRAERWPTAPALTYSKDHLVAIFRRPSITEGSK